MRRAIVVSASLLVFGCSHVDRRAADDVAPPALDLQSLDTDVSPCDDFFSFACGKWQAKTQIPAGREAWSRARDTIYSHGQSLLRNELEADASGHGDRQNPYRDQLGKFWASCMDEAQVEANAAAELRAILASIDEVKDFSSLAKVMAALQSRGIQIFFSLDPAQDPRDSSRLIGQLLAEGMGMPDRSLYLNDDEKTTQLRHLYQKHIETMFGLAGVPPSRLREEATTAILAEKLVAYGSLSIEAISHPEELDHPMSLSELHQMSPHFPWEIWFAALGHPAITTINVPFPKFFSTLDAALAGAPMEEIRPYLRWQVINAVAGALPKKFVQEDFQMKQAFTGQTSPLPRWQLCVYAVSLSMPEAIARTFVDQALSAESKSRSLMLVRAVEKTMASEVRGLSWMDAATRRQAEQKLSLVRNKIGYPDAWSKQTALQLDRKSFLENLLKIEAARTQENLARIGTASNPDDWADEMPQDVNAHYAASRNEMTFPAGILQRPMFDPAAPDAVNFGSIGAVMGHELVHAFEGDGRKFDGRGNFSDWWSPDSELAFSERTSCVEKQADDFVAIGNYHVSGKQTATENVADLGGVALAYKAFEAYGSRGPNVAGFSPEQQFFLAYAQSHCEKRNDAYEQYLLTVDPHAPPRFRVNGPLSNLPAFQQAFRCKDGDKMVRPRGERCEMW